MRDRPTTRLAWSLCALSFVLTMLGLLLLILSWSPVGIPSYASAPVFDYWLESALMGISFSAVGAVIAPYLPPQNPIGWVFCAIGLLAGMQLFSAEYAVVTLLAEPGSVLGILPGGEALAWLSMWLWIGYQRRGGGSPGSGAKTRRDPDGLRHAGRCVAPPPYYEPKLQLRPG